MLTAEQRAQRDKARALQTLVEEKLEQNQPERIDREARTHCAGGPFGSDYLLLRANADVCSHLSEPRRA